jgi:hypothetical protein
MGSTTLPRSRPTEPLPTECVMAFRGRSLIPLSRSSSSESRDLVPSQSRDVAPRQSSLPDQVHDYQQQEPDGSRDLIPAPRVSWWRSSPKEDRTPTHREIEIRSRDDDRHYPESRYYPDEDHHYPESYHHRRPPPSPYRGYEWDEDPRAAHPSTSTSTLRTRTTTKSRRAAIRTARGRR